MNLNEFRTDNTEGFTNEQLKWMNKDLAEKIIEYGYESIDDIDRSTLDHLAQKVMDAYQ